MTTRDQRRMPWRRPATSVWELVSRAGVAMGWLYRILHPVRNTKRRIKRAIVPRPIRRAGWIAGGVAHPLSRAEYLAKRAVIREINKAIAPKRQRKPAQARRSRLSARTIVEPATPGHPIDCACKWCLP
jgi:hypothetical protein